MTKFHENRTKIVDFLLIVTFLASALFFNLPLARLLFVYRSNFKMGDFEYIVNFSIWSVHWDEAKKFKYFLKLIKDVQKKVDDKRFVGKTGKVSL